MILLLMLFRNSSFAVDMTYVSRIINIAKTQTGKELFLLPPDSAATGIILKSECILPADSVEEMLAYDGSITPANPFLKGCMKNTNIESFVIINNKIYGVLSSIFLKNNCKRS
ncbi:MAG: hypothetical protein GY757_55810 [bacterium]|nr:hypothetical protein [bacterium]